MFIKIRLKTAQLFSKHFPFDLSLCILYFIFHKRSDTSAIPQPSFQDLVYVSSIFFGFHKCFNNFYWSKNVFINKCFDWIICFFIVLFPWHKGIAGFSLKQNNLIRLKTKRFFFILTDNHAEIWDCFHKKWLNKNKKRAFTSVRLEVILCKSESE